MKLNNCQRLSDLYHFIFFPAGEANFIELSINQPGYYYILAKCGDYELTGPEFAVHDWPDMATVRKQTIGLRYTGSLYYAVETINALNKVIAEDHDEISVTDVETGLPSQHHYIDLSNYNPRHDPTCIKGITCMF